MDTEDTGSSRDGEPELEASSEVEEEDGARPTTSSGSSSSQNSNRNGRKQAEKVRRDRLNSYINELSTLVPIISLSPKKLDKTSILRLAATYIRLNNVIFGPERQDDRSAIAQSNVRRQMLTYLPRYLSSSNWSESVLEEMDGMLMIVNGAGRIIFISNTVEKVLGHTQIELMGQSLFKLTCLEDYDELKRNLAPDDDPTNTGRAITGEPATDDSSSDSSSEPATPPSCMPIIPFYLDNNTSDERQRRSFYIRLRQRAHSRSDQPQYELVHVMGHLRVPPSSQPSTSRKRSQPLNQNNIILVAVVKPFKEKRITALSLMEACREEFITRHTLDGRIIYTDHRISTVAGYMAEEVCGIPGFQYMHKEDMRWTMVGLRQMFFRGSSYGQSCYRLQTKNGTFIYLKTCGYLELSENNDSFQSLICINSLVTPVEGELLIRQMKDQYSPVIKSKGDRNIEKIVHGVGKNETRGETEDPKILELAINEMISNVPSSPATFINPSLPSVDPTEPQFAKATLAAKAMPPLSAQIKKIGITPPIIKTPAAIAADMSPLSSNHSPPMMASPPQPPPMPTPPQQPLKACPQQNRPSVLRMVHSQGDPVVVQPDRILKRRRTDDEAQEVITNCMSVSPHSVVSPSDSSASGKRRSDESNEWPSPLHVDISMSPATSPTPTLDQAISLSPQFPLDSLLSSVDDTDILEDFRMMADDAFTTIISQ